MLVCRSPDEKYKLPAEANKTTTDEMLEELRTRDEYQDHKVLMKLITEMKTFGIKFDNAVRLIFKFERGTTFQWAVNNESATL